MRRNALPHYGMLSALLLGALCAADVARHRFALSLRSWLVLLLLAGVLGAMHGTAFRLVLALIGRLRSGAHWLVFASLGGAVSLLEARSLNAFARLSSPYRKLALLVLLACAASAVGLTLLGLALAPTPRAQQGRARAWRRPFRVGLFLSLSGLAVTCFYFEPRYYPDAYPTAHDALRWASLWLALGALGVTAVDASFELAPRRQLIASLVGMGLLLLCGSVWPRSVDELVRAGGWSLSLVRTTRNALDFDRDGYAALLGGGDCNDFNPRVHPGAREIPGNGIDDNCLLGDAKPRPRSFDVPKSATEPSPNDVILLIVDSLRPDHIGAFNPAMGAHGRNTTPNIDAWAANFALTFEHAYATGGWTSISVPSLMRGVYARRLTWTRYYELLSHALVREDQLVPGGERVLQMFPLAWHDPHPSLAGLFKRRGMRTIALVDDGWSGMLTHGTGIERDFDVYRELDANPGLEQSDAGLVAMIEQELARAPKDQRLFLWAHFFGVHSLNEVHAGIPSYGPSISDGYDHEVRFLDSLWPRLWAAIGRRGTNVVTVLTSDHGEVFVDYARMHGFSASEADIRVPMFIHVPGLPPRRVAQLISTVDLFPTLLAQTRTPAPERIDGLDLQRFMTGAARVQPRMLIADTWRYTADAQPIIDLTAAVDGHTKVLLNAVDQSYQALDVSRGTETPSAADAPDAEALRGFLDAYVDATGGALDPAR